MTAAVELPVFPTPRQAQREHAQRIIMARHLAIQSRVENVTGPQTAIFLGCRRWFRPAAVRNDFRHARRLTLGERMAFRTLRRLFGAAS